MLLKPWKKKKMKMEPEAAEEDSPSSTLSFISSVFTLFIFTLALIITPYILLLYLGVKAWRQAWLRWLEGRYPGLDFVAETTPRTAVDTRRNQGIITLLIGSDTHTNLQLLNSAIQNEVSRCRRLKQVLTSRWGRYAWVPRSEVTFSLDNHIFLAPTNFKGRPLNDLNLQEYVSDVVSKLLPPDTPQWQIVLINMQSGDSYLLIRLHHLYVSTEKVRLGDLLMRAKPRDPPCPEESLIRTLLAPPVVIPQIWDQLNELCSNWAREIVSKWDPLESPGVPWEEEVSLGLALRLSVVALIAWWRGSSGLALECKRRGLNLSFLSASAYSALTSPLSTATSLVSFFLSATASALSYPFFLVRDAPVYLYWLYLAHYAARETLSIAAMIYRAPRILLEELVIPEHPRNVHRLQTLSLCGRKAVCWSDPVDLSSLEPLKRATSATTPEILIAATAASLQQYFQESGGGGPDCLMASCRVVEGGGGSGGSGGVFLLPLPLRGGKGRGGRGWLESTRRALAGSAPRQPPLYLASSLDLLTALLPTLLARAALYLLSRRYTVGMTLVTSDASPPKRRLLWGPTIRTLVYWRPPQANACLSLSLMCYGGEVRLGVMSDGQLSPHQATITRSFPLHLRAIAATAPAIDSDHPSS